MAILISIKPKYVEKILNREKTIEMRKSIPKCQLPCKVYIYCTKLKDHKHYTDEVDIPLETGKWLGNGYVIAEFTLNTTEKFECCSDDFEWLVNHTNCCLSMEEVLDYCKGQDLYGWYIDNLTIYDKPKELSEFYKKCKYCNNEKLFICANNFSECDKITKIKRPPQSWCYVEDIGEEL